MRQRNIARRILPLALLMIVCSGLASTPFPPKIELTPGFYYRSPGSVGFKLCDDNQVLESGSILTVKSSFISPLATETKILCGSHTISFFPGATAKILADGLQPLSGRIEIVSEKALEPLVIHTARFSGEINDGHLLLEVTPDSGTFIAMRNRGQAWFKDRSRKIFELESGHELHFPLFGPTVEMPILSGFWADQPSSFSAARKKIAGRSFPDGLHADETSEIASDTEDAVAVNNTEDTASGSNSLDTSNVAEKAILPASGNASATTDDAGSALEAD